MRSIPVVLLLVACAPPTSPDAGSGGGSEVDAGAGGGSVGGEAGGGSGGGVSCGGCLNGGACVSGTERAACGNSGNQCEACTDHETCSSGHCVVSCDASCGGCCGQGECLDGGVDAACGAGGNVCSVCGAGLACSSGACVATARFGFVYYVDTRDSHGCTGHAPCDYLMDLPADRVARLVDVYGDAGCVISSTPGTPPRWDAHCLNICTTGSTSGCCVKYPPGAMYGSCGWDVPP